jgi:hypothetical protein
VVAVVAVVAVGAVGGGNRADFPLTARCHGVSSRLIRIRLWHANVAAHPRKFTAGPSP